MDRVLLVEDKLVWQIMQNERLERIVGEGNVDIAGCYDAAVSMLSKPYAAYILDGEFPRSIEREPEKLGIELALGLQERGIGLDKVFFVSGNPDVCENAQRNGIPNVYTKGLAYEGVGDLSKLIADLRAFFEKPTA